MDIATFYNMLSSFVQHIPKHNVLIIGRDMDAQIGKNEKNRSCSHHSLNRIDKYLEAVWYIVTPVISATYCYSYQPHELAPKGPGLGWATWYTYLTEYPYLPTPPLG